MSDGTDGGQRAFDGRSIPDILRMVRENERTDLTSKIPERYRGLLVQALAPDPAERRITMGELATALSA